MPTTRPLRLTYLRPDASATPAATALVPVVASTQRAPPTQPVPPPDPIFVTQLIASAEQLKERRRWPRDRAADACSAYGACQHRTIGAGLKTRHMI